MDMIFYVLFGIMIFSIVGMTIYSIVHVAMTRKDQKKSITEVFQMFTELENDQNSKLDNEEQMKKTEKNICEYCGTPVDQTSSTCPSCGAKIKK